MRAKKIILYSLLILIILGLSGYYYIFIHQRLKAPSWNLQTKNINIEGIERTFDFYIPNNLTDSASLVFLLHGSDGTAQIMRYLTNYEFEKQCEKRKNFILVYPQGYDNHWNDCRKSATYNANVLNINEIDFFKEMIIFFTKQYKIDKRKVFSIGYSNGGHMCYKLAYELPEFFKGVGIYSANLPELENNDCNPKNQSISILIINGSDDPINPINGGLVVLDGDSSRGSVTSSISTYNYFKSLFPDSCQNIKDEQFNYSDNVLSNSAFCNYNKNKIELITIEDGGHTIPLISTPPYLPSRIGHVETSINSADIMLNFFENLAQ